MEKERIIFQNSTKYINEGYSLGEGILYCGRIYTSPNNCACGQCTGQCGPDDGCACPDCEYTLSYILFSTGKMQCEKCQKTLLRINIFNLKNIVKSNSKSNPTFQCNICHKHFTNQLFIPLMHCMRCNYNICPKCAFSKISYFEPKKPYIESGFKLGAGMIYCKKNYANPDYCLCGGCDGNCGPENGCPCPLCDSILCYNIYLKSNFMNCNKCKDLLSKTTFFQLKKYLDENKMNKLKCFLCSLNYRNDFEIIYYCYKCNTSLCKLCAFKKNILNMKNICFPKMPIFLDYMAGKIIQNKNMKELKIVKEKNFKIIKKEGGRNISIYLKTLIGRIYTININDSETIRKLKEELRKIDEKYREYKTLLIYKNKTLDDDKYISDYELDNENIIYIISK